MRKRICKESNVGSGLSGPPSNVPEIEFLSRIVELDFFPTLVSLVSGFSVSYWQDLKALWSQTPSSCAIVLKLNVNIVQYTRVETLSNLWTADSE